MPFPSKPAPTDEPLFPVASRNPTLGEGPAKTAQMLVARWVDGLRSTGQPDAPGPLMARVAGQMGRLAKACRSHDDWCAAYHAAYAAGEAGRADAVPFMVQVQSRYRRRDPVGEGFDASARAAGFASGGAMLGAYFGVPQRGSHGLAIGDGS